MATFPHSDCPSLVAARAILWRNAAVWLSRLPDPTSVLSAIASISHWQVHDKQYSSSEKELFLKFGECKQWHSSSSNKHSHTAGSPLRTLPVRDNKGCMHCTPRGNRCKTCPGSVSHSEKEVQHIEMPFAAFTPHRRVSNRNNSLHPCHGIVSSSTF